MATPTSFIPYQNKRIIPGYAMTSSFANSGAGLDIISEKYANYLSNLISGNSVPNQHAIGKAIGTLQTLIRQERNAELTFLSEIANEGVIMNNTSEDWKKLIESFNLIFSTEEVFKFNLARLKKVSAKGGKYEDVTRFLQNTYIPMAVKECLSKIKDVSQINEALAEKVMRRAVQLMYQYEGNRVDSKEKVEAYKEIWEALKKLTYKNTLFKGLSSLFQIEDYLTANFNALKAGEKVSITSTEKYPAGKVLELMEQTIVGQGFKSTVVSNQTSGMFNFSTTVNTGSSLQKADNAVVIAESSVNVSSLTQGNIRKDDSIRLRSIERIEELLDRIGDKKAQIVFMSDKNYQIGKGTFFNDNKGFTAETPTLNSLNTYGAQFHIPNVTNMIEYLASAGDDMVVNDVESCMKVIEICIGNFLFDDLQISAPAGGNINRVHLLNLSGTYVPASVYLEATYQGLLGIDGYNSEDFVDASFEPKETTPSGNTLDSWNNFKIERMKSKIHISFLSNYVNFMAKVFS